MLNLKAVFRPYIIKNKIILLAVFLLLSCINCFSQTITQNDVFDCWGGIIGVIKNNEVTFHEYIEWRKRWERPLKDTPGMKLPPGFKEVYAYRNGKYAGSDPRSLMLIVNVSDTLQYYENNGNLWRSSSTIPPFKLPNGYKSFFVLGFGMIGVVTGNGIQTYAPNEDNSWEIFPFYLFDIIKIPDNQKGIIFTASAIGLNINDTIKFQIMVGSKNENAYIPVVTPKTDMKLPNNYKGAFTITLGNNDVYLGVIFDDRVDFYDLYFEGQEQQLRWLQRELESNEEEGELDSFLNSEYWNYRTYEWKIVSEMSFRK